MIKDNTKGYLFAILSTLSGSVVYILSKAALMDISLPQFGLYWFASGIVWNSLFVMYKSKSIAIKLPPRSSMKILVILGFIEIVATSTLYGAIYVTSDASIPSFLRNLEFMFVALLGVLLLKEKFSKSEGIGVLLVLTGAVFITYTKGITLNSYFSSTSGLMLISSVFYAIRTITAKKNIKLLSPSTLSINRAIFNFSFGLIMLLILGHSFHIPMKAFLFTASGAFFGPFLTSYSQYSALKFIEASRAAIIQSTTPLFVLLASYLYFSRLPLQHQIWGGMLTIAGTFLLMKGKDIGKTSNNKILK